MRWFNAKFLWSLEIISRASFKFLDINQLSGWTYLSLASTHRLFIFLFDLFFKADLLLRSSFSNLFFHEGIPSPHLFLGAISHSAMHELIGASTQSLTYLTVNESSVWLTHVAEKLQTQHKKAVTICIDREFSTLFEASLVNLMLFLGGYRVCFRFQFSNQNPINIKIKNSAKILKVCTKCCCRDLTRVYRGRVRIADCFFHRPHIEPHYRPARIADWSGLPTSQSAI